MLTLILTDQLLHYIECAKMPGQIKANTSHTPWKYTLP